MFFSERILTIIFTLSLVYQLVFSLTSSSATQKGPADWRAEALRGEPYAALARGKASVSSHGLAATDLQPKVSAEKTHHLEHWLQLHKSELEANPVLLCGS